MKDFEILFYTKQDGSQPVSDFIIQLDSKMRVKVMRNIELLRTTGHETREPYTKHLRNGIFELRTKQGSDISRVLYFFVIDQKIVLTNGFIKKTQKTPVNEIALAEKYRQEFLSQEKNIKG